ncbi:MAG TPA: nitroreductase family protein [bacterium]|nr:nitroreductase family protein [bacterium]
MKRHLIWIALLLSAAGLLAPGVGLFAQDITLTKPPARLGTDVLDAIRERTAARAFVARDVPLADLSVMVWAGNGMKDTPDAVSGASKAGSTIPISGDVNYINLYVLTAKGAWRFLPAKNLLQQVASGDVRASITPEVIPSASLMFVFTADSTKAPPFMKKMPALFHDVANGSASYGAENIGLVAGSLKMSSIVMYNLKMDTLASALKLPKEEIPLTQVGYTK